MEIQLPNHALRPPSRGELLPAETQINTEDGRILLRLADGSDLLVRSNTRLVLKQPETNGWRYVQVLVGRVRAEIQKRLGTNPGFQIGTPSAVISVRGTAFDVEVNRAGLTEVDVREGVVQLQSAKGMGQSVLIALDSPAVLVLSPDRMRRVQPVRRCALTWTVLATVAATISTLTMMMIPSKTCRRIPMTGVMAAHRMTQAEAAVVPAADASGGSGDSGGTKDSGSGDHGGHDHGSGGPPEF